MSSDLRTKVTTGSLQGNERTSTASGRLRTPTTSGIHRTEPPPSAPTTPTQPFKLSPSEFNTAMVHFYRGEVQRSNTWRNRLDTTTNWAVITAGAPPFFVFFSPSNPQFVFSIKLIFVGNFFLVEDPPFSYSEICASDVAG